MALQAYEMRRYVMANARKRTQRKFEDLYFDEDMFEEVQYYGDHHIHHHHGGPMEYRAHQSETGRAENLLRKKQFPGDFRLKIAHNDLKIGIFTILSFKKWLKQSKINQNRSKSVFSSVSRVESLGCSTPDFLERITPM
ncbi:hypothetical protein B9Z55_028674 [Caenorhabditis nigoni]|uniref:Uncharacterized protein n=1 Tax=Caenorhabditis nigoni TaxID=1611254 RepID=A0A2G5SAW0_9PELO|nr:hypothetical protein B9Z55_028674 [Caenorhabditis nigoni]